MESFLQSVVLGQQIADERQNRGQTLQPSRNQRREEGTNTSINLLNSLNARRTTHQDPPTDRPSGPQIPPTIELPTLNLLVAAALHQKTNESQQHDDDTNLHLLWHAMTETNVTVLYASKTCEAGNLLYDLNADTCSMHNVGTITVPTSRPSRTT